MTCLRDRHQLGVFAQVGNQVRAGVGGQKDQRVLEVDETPFAVFHVALVEDLCKKWVAPLEFYAI